MEDPVILVETGVTFEKQAIKDWFKKGKHRTCPATSRPVCHVQLVSNLGLRQVSPAAHFKILLYLNMRFAGVLMVLIISCCHCHLVCLLSGAPWRANVREQHHWSKAVSIKKRISIVRGEKKRQRNVLLLFSPACLLDA